MHEKCVHELIVGFQMSMSVDLDLNADLDLDLDLDLDDYLLHPQTPPCLRIIHAFMHNRIIEHVREETVRIEDGVLRQEQLIWCIKQQQQQKHLEQQFGRGVGLMKHFKLRAMFLYNMDLNAEDMRDFFRSQSQSQSHESSLSSRFLTPVSAVDDVVIKPTIPMFARLNALHIMYEASDCQQQHNQQQQQQQQQHNRSIKRVVIHKKKQKHTRRT